MTLFEGQWASRKHVHGESKHVGAVGGNVLGGSFCFSHGQ